MTAAASMTKAELVREVERLTSARDLFGKLIHNQVVANQAAWIEWQHGKGAEAAMQWIENGLFGPDQIPDEDEPYGKEAQAWMDANRADPLPTCPCGRPSNIGWMGKGYCSDEHYARDRATGKTGAEGGV